jgi:4-hydroxy-tetrahydrodipicolinate synthase
MNHTLSNPLRGVIPPMVTPLASGDSLDVEGTDRLIEHLIDGGVHGIFILGTTGEAPSLSYPLRRQLIDRACKRVAGRVPVLVGVTDSSAVESVRLARFAAEAGAQALVLAPSFYFPQDQDDLLAYTRAIVGELPLPVFLYNMPTHTKVEISPETLQRLLDVERIVGLKDSAPGATCFHAVRQFVARQRPDFSLLIGSEQLMNECIPLGAHGGVTGGANVFPKLFVDLYDATVRGDVARAAELQAQVLRVGETIYAIGNTSYAPIRTIKAALAVKGICDARLASPLRDLGESQVAQVRVAVARFEAPLASATSREVAAADSVKDHLTVGMT